ncbi:hypothetical protein, partial [Mesorhizobium sp.]|uniref:hypothetical protein n=1 Tax=Mesorhizobium sp. TaxID=1871066 RepID=UPI0025FE4FEE
PCGGDVRQDRGGVKESNLSIPQRSTATLPFAGIDAQPRTAIYFPHSGCVFARVAIGRAKADNAASQMQGEKP